MRSHFLRFLPPSNIKFVGSITGLGTSLSLTSLTGGVSTTAQVGDLIICVAAYAAGSATGMTTPTGFTEIAYREVSDTHDIALGVYYKISTGDTSIANVDGTGANFAMVFRGINTTPFDVPAAVATGISSALCNPPSITTVKPGALIVAIGATAQSTSDVGFGNSSPLPRLYFIERTYDSGTYYTVAGANCYLSIGGLYDPPAWNGGNTSTSNSWAAVTLAIRSS